MSSPEPDRDLERRLAAWRPTTPPDRDRMLFAAGAASSRPPRRRDWAWAAGLGVALLGLGWQSHQLGQARAERVELQRALIALRSDHPERPPATTMTTTVAAPAPAPDSYLALSRDLLRVADATGVDQQPPPHPEPGPGGPPTRTLRVRDFDRLPPT